MPVSDMAQVYCPICHTARTPTLRHSWDGEHHMFVCCGRRWDVCCQREFARALVTPEREMAQATQNMRVMQGV